MSGEINLSTSDVGRETSPGGDPESLNGGASAQESQVPTGQQRRDVEQGLVVEENDALREIDNLLWIKNLPINNKNRCREALSSWAQKDRQVTSRLERKRKQSSAFQNEVYQQVGFFYVFQGVLLTAVSQSNLLHCNNVWTAMLLSALATFVTVIGVCVKLRNIRDLQKTIKTEESSRRLLGAWQRLLRTYGENFSFDIVKAKSEEKVQRRRKREQNSALWLSGTFAAVVVILILFAVAFVVSFHQILCNPGHSPSP